MICVHVEAGKSISIAVDNRLEHLPVTIDRAQLTIYVLVYKTYCDEYPQKRRIINEGYQDQVLASDHHPAIIEKEKFLKVQAERARRSNIVVNADGTKKRKDTHYSSKSAGKSENLHGSRLG